MNILVINGSPKVNNSNSLKLTNAFLEGIEAALGSDKPAIERLDVANLNISSCRGCFSCWNKTPGKCVIHDDMEKVIEKLLWSDLTVWSFPLYYFSVPGKLKMLMDRQLPMSLPFMAKDAESGGHPTRYDMSGKKTVLISTCGFYTAEDNYNAVRAQFDRLYGENGYTAIFCGEGELFRVPELRARTDEYLSYVREAGKEYITGGISPETAERLSELLYPRNVFERMADASWGVSESGEKEDTSFIFTRQMAALYNPSSYKGKDIVFDMDYTDIEKRYRIVLGKDKSTVSEVSVQQPDNTSIGSVLKPDTVIHTPFTVWKEIAEGKYDGPEALMKHLYTVEGDFSLMLDWDTYFTFTGGKKSVPVKKDRAEKNSTMVYMLLAWISFWVAAPISSFYGSIITIIVCAILPIIFFRNRKTIYDVISCTAATGFSLLMMLGASPLFLVPFSYFAFGLMWTVSVFLRIPLTAQYSKNGYGGDKALENPMFIKTNRILTAVWGVFYLITPTWTYLIMQTGAGYLSGAVNSALPILLGLFTAWFQKWYPAKIAEGQY
jgi:multimeric flavodoxin WrbA/putative sterol carrier protein